MLGLFICITVLLQAFCISGTEIDILRNSCFTDEEKNCDEDFVEVHKDLSRSKTGMLADTYFLLFTRKNTDEPEKLHKCAGKLPPNSNFNPKNKIILIAPSYLSTFCELAVYKEWKNELLKKEDVTVIAIDYDWEKVDYKDAHANLKLVAKQTVVVLNNIKEQSGASKLDVTLIGLSLGAQLGGYIGKVYDLERIIGLDPGGPSFNNAPENERLNPSDAKLVDIWHCNAGDNILELGANYDAGHVNYYINGGKFQESCIEPGLESAAKGDIAYSVGTLVACSHIQCTQYFKETINPVDCQYIGVKCKNYEDFLDGKCRRCGSKGENCLLMGYDLGKVIKEVPQEPQRFYVKTKLIPPFCGNDYVNLDGYEATYNSSLPKSPCKKKEKRPKETNFFDKLIRIIKDFICVK